VSYSISITGLQQVKAMLGRDFRPTMQVGLKKIAVDVLNELATPPGPVHLPLHFASAKQRGWFIKSYLPSRKARGLGRWKRESDPDSKGLLKSWHVATTGPMRVIVANKGVPYAPWVQSAAQQQPMHKATGWVTDKQAGETVVKDGRAKRHIINAIVARLKGR
jgi:hypothetical protein